MFRLITGFFLILFTSSLETSVDFVFLLLTGIPGLILFVNGLLYVICEDPERE